MNFKAVTLYCPDCGTTVQFADTAWYVAHCHLCNIRIAKCDWLTQPKEESYV